MAKTRKLQRIKRILNCIPSPETERDWTFRDALQAEILGAVTALPASKDWRTTWWAIGDQGSTGSCVGWGAADSVIRWHMVQAGRLQKNERLSVRYVWMASKETDQFNVRPTSFIEESGTSLKAALDIARKYGAVLDADLPFRPGALYGGAENVFYATAAQRKISMYFNLGRNLKNWRIWLAKHGPILTRLDVDATWDNATDTQGKLAVYEPDTTRGGHAVSLVGYTSEHFIVRNSWGTGWGDKGFGYASNAYAQAAFTEAYGVAV